MHIHEIIKKRSDLQAEQQILLRDWADKNSQLEKEINELKRLEQIGGTGLDLNKILIGEKILNCRGNIWAKVDNRIIAEAAIVDIANNCQHLSAQYFGNKTYGSYYQSSDHPYGYGPKHGGIHDAVGLSNNYRTQNLTDEEKDACIYYLQNYKQIIASKEVKA